MSVKDGPDKRPRLVNQFTRTMAPSGPNYGAGGRSYGTRTRLAWDRPVYHRRGAGIDRGRGLDCPVTSGHQAILRGGFLRKDRSGRLEDMTGAGRAKEESARRQIVQRR
jgi:hypothetical protein